MLKKMIGEFLDLVWSVVAALLTFAFFAFVVGLGCRITVEAWRFGWSFLK